MCYTRKLEPIAANIRALVKLNPFVCAKSYSGIKWLRGRRVLFHRIMTLTAIYYQMRREGGRNRTRVM